MLIREKVFYGLRELAAILRVSVPHAAKLVREGSVPATTVSGQGVRWRIHRDAILKFMRLHQYPDELLRWTDAPPKGVLMWLGRSPDLDWSKLSQCNPKFVRSAFKLGRLVSFTPTWGILFDLSCFPGGMAVASEIGEDPYCPLLIALLAADVTRKDRKAAVKVFDLVLPRPFRSSRAVASELAQFRLSKSVNPRVTDASGSRFKPVGRGKS